MTKKKYRRYSAEFKQHALRRASEDGVTDKEVWKWQSSGAGLQRRNRNGIF
jgi:transposase-like protein